MNNWVKLLEICYTEIEWEGVGQGKVRGAARQDIFLGGSLGGSDGEENYTLEPF